MATDAVAPLIGVLALQGDVVEHIAALQRAGADAIPVKNRADLARVEGLIIPGGESTTVMKLLDRFRLAAPIVERARAGMPLWGTCMGMIVVARDVVGTAAALAGSDSIFPCAAMRSDVKTILRKWNCRSRRSANRFPAIFIRAPWIERAGPQVESLGPSATATA